MGSIPIARSIPLKEKRDAAGARSPRAEPSRAAYRMNAEVAAGRRWHYLLRRMPDALVSPRLFPRAVLIVTALIGVLVAATLTLWAHYGTAVFYEMVVAGLAACF